MNTGRVGISTVEIAIGYYAAMVTGLLGDGQHRTVSKLFVSNEPPIRDKDGRLNIFKHNRSAYAVHAAV